MKAKRRGFTLVELLVVIAIIAMLLGILMPTLAKVRQLAYRMICASNLSGMGKAILIYSNDYDEEYPIGGDSTDVQWSTDGVIDDWQSEDYPWGSDDGTRDVTITSCLYLLVKYAEVTPEQFACKGDTTTKKWEISDEPDVLISDITDAWDLGETPGKYCSYSYQHPFAYSASAAVAAAAPIASDRNPWTDERAKLYINGQDSDEDPATWDTAEDEYKDDDKTCNSAAHQREGQNVLFNDMHVKFEKYPNCGISSDNIWETWESTTPNVAAGEKEVEGLNLGGEGDPRGAISGNDSGGAEGGPKEPVAEEDAFLVGETQREVSGGRS